MKVMQPGGVTLDIKDVDGFVKKWRPIDGWLIADHSGFVLPTHHGVLGHKFYASFRRKARIDVVILLACTFLVSVLFQVSNIDDSLKYIVIFDLLFLLAVVDRVLSILSLKCCKQKVTFIYAFKRAFKKLAGIFVFFFFGIFLLQYYLTDYFGSFENLVMVAGNYYPNIELMSSWRFLTGPFIHQDTQHWALNGTLTLLFASFIPQGKKRHLFFLLFVGAVFSHWVTYVVHCFWHTSFDSLVGMSGGAFTLLAYAITYYVRLRHFNTVFTLLGIFVLGEFSADLIAINTSHLAHFTGFVIGILVGIRWQWLPCLWYR